MADWVNLNGTMLPKFLASDLSWAYYPQQQQQEPWYGNEEARSIGSGNQPLPSYYAGQVTANNGGDYGNFNNASGWSDNYMIGQVLGDKSPEAFDLRIKSQDKVGSNYRYQLQDGYWTPTQYLGDQGWNTNRMEPADWARMVAAAIGAPAIGMAIAGLAGGAVGGASGSGGLTALGEGAVGLGEAAGTGLLDAGALAGSEGALAGLGGVEPISTSGFTGAQGGIGSLGSGWGMPGGVVAGEGGAATLGGAGSSFWGNAGDAIKDYVTDPKNASTLLKVGGLLGGALGGAASGSGGSSGPYEPVGTPSINHAPPTFQAQGDTETERRMMQYLPSLFNQQAGGLLGGVPPIRRNLLGMTVR